jgi:hypothetical protein
VHLLQFLYFLTITCDEFPFNLTISPRQGFETCNRTIYCILELRNQLITA